MRYCRRMYNVSHFMKTLNERVAAAVKARTGHEGPVFAGRFHSTLVEGDFDAVRLVVLDVDYTPCRRGMVQTGELYKWSSYGWAHGDSPPADEARRAYETVWECSWDKACEQINRMMDERLPEGSNIECLVLAGELQVTPGQLVKLNIPELSRGAYIGHDISYEKTVKLQLPVDFPCPSFRSLRRLVRMVKWKQSRPFVA